MARPYTVEDLLRTEDFGAISFDPHGRWLIFERQESFLKMSRFDMLGRANVLRSRLYRVDLHAPWRARPLLSDPAPGTIIYDLSADGDRLAIGRLTGNRWRLGIVAMATGAVRWLDVSPDYDPFYTSVEWLSDRRLAVIASPSSARPWWLRVDGFPAEALPARWNATRSGAATAVTAVGSGRFRDMGPRPPDTVLLSIDAVSGRSETLATGQFLSMTVAPDRRHIALIERGAIATLHGDRPAGLSDQPFRRSFAIYSLDRRRLWRPCPDCDMLGDAKWSPDGGKLAFMARRGDRGWPQAGLLTADADRRSLTAADTAGLAPAIDEFPDGSTRGGFGWRGADLILFARPRSAPTDRNNWYVLHGSVADPLTSDLAHPTPAIATIDGCGAAMNTADGVWCLDGSNPKRLFDAGTWAGDGGVIGWRRAPEQVAITGTVLPGYTVAVGAHDRVSRIDGSDKAQMLVVRAIADNGVKTLTLVTRNHVGTVATANRHLADVPPAGPRRLIYSLADGQYVTSWLYLPPDIRDGEKPALVVIPYPGEQFGSEPPADQALGADRFYANAQILAGRGYAVLLPSLPVAQASISEPPGFIDDVNRAVNAAAATGRIDPDRIALWGHSYGAYAVAMILAGSCRYSTGIASSGIYDLGAITGIFGPITRLAPERSLPIGQYFAWAETGQGKLGVPPWVDPARYIAASPFYRADRISAPMLFIAADRDPAPMQQAEQLFSALFRQDKDAELVTYWGEGHVVGSPANVRDLYSRVFNWLAMGLASPHVGGCRPTGSRPAAYSTRAPNAP